MLKGGHVFAWCLYLQLFSGTTLAQASPAGQMQTNDSASDARVSIWGDTEPSPDLGPRNSPPEDTRFEDSLALHTKAPLPSEGYASSIVTQSLASPPPAPGIAGSSNNTTPFSTRPAPQPASGTFTNTSGFSPPASTKVSEAPPPESANTSAITPTAVDRLSSLAAPDKPSMSQSATTISEHRTCGAGCIAGSVTGSIAGVALIAALTYYAWQYHCGRRFKRGYGCSS